MFKKFFPENSTVPEVMWENPVKPNRRHDNIIGCIRIACWITKATHSEYVTSIGFPRQQRLRERASVLYYTYITCLVVITATDRFLKRLYIQLQEFGA
jgi:hypothetical protein